MVGLGRMGGNMVLRLLKRGHRLVAFDLSPDAVKRHESAGAVGAGSWEEFVSKFSTKPRVMWIMVPAGDPTTQAINKLIELGDPGERLTHALAFAVNDVGMAFVFALLTQEVLEATMPGGALHTWRRAAVPIVAAIGGTIGAIAAYDAFVLAGDEHVLSSGWPIVLARRTSATSPAVTRRTPRTT